MPITFENEDDIIVFALERIISFARRTHQIFVAQCIWWLATVIGLEPKLITHIDNLHGRTVVDRDLGQESITNDKISEVLNKDNIHPKDHVEDLHQDKVLRECE